MANRLIKHRKSKSSRNLKASISSVFSSSEKEPVVIAETQEHTQFRTSTSTPEPPAGADVSGSSNPTRHGHSQSMTATSTYYSHNPPTSRRKPTPEPPSNAVSTSHNPGTTSKMLSTIRTVPSFEGVLSDTSSDAPSVNTKTSAFSSSSVTSNASAVSMTSNQVDDHLPTVRLKVDSSSTWVGRESNEGPLPRLSRESATSRQQLSSHLSHSRAAESPSNNAPTLSLEPHDPPPAQPWDSTIGKAGLGKTGRVINKLVGDNEALKRDIKIERLRADEAKQAAKLVEDKMERLVQDYESRLLEANVTKTLLARKERQVESLNSAIEIERRKASIALDRERNWRDEMEKAQRDAKLQVEDANTHAMLMEGRYNSISSHWRDQGEEVKRSTTKLRRDIVELIEERRRDDEKIITLQELCDQQDSSIKELIRQKEEIARQFEAYKQEQENWLRDVKVNALSREQEQEQLLEETRQTLAKLKWALNVKENVRGAQ
ncbi:hypothetical protein jhhlp_002278 [Lomentospora prolificans]|uniref:SWI5-dependent HO expression protein 3 n=1 Tax=Lomentospora prolificans TaxID=41688 RepID=A0A2N3NDK0_9PEZI|nr:hypothetical protein jhhlp_002278 [Lomentospora prolificans]